MFSFLFKRSRNYSGTSSQIQVAPEPAPSRPTDRPALPQLSEITGDEAACADFILRCDSASDRLQAAQYIQSEQVLRQVVNAMRNTDRRIVKLMQQRLDAIARDTAQREQVRTCMERAQSLARQPLLLPNQVAALESEWQAIGVSAEEAQHAFAQVYQTLQRRLLAQTALQRDLIELRRHLQELALSANSLITPAEELRQHLARAGQRLAECRMHPEAAAMPKHLLQEISMQLEQLQKLPDILEQRMAAISAREQLLKQWESAPPQTLDRVFLQKEWQGLPTLPVEEAPLWEARFNAILARAAAKSLPQKKQQPDDRAGQAAALIQAMETALAQGTLQAAAECDEALAALDDKSWQLPAAYARRITKARMELARLQGWAKWGGKVSREELLRAAQELPQQSLPVAELARQVGRLRAAWKKLDAVAGSSGKESWERFDAACNAAYAPVAQHFEQLELERKRNSEHAQALLDEISRLTAAIAGKAEGDVDWKEVVSQRSRLLRRWEQLGPIERRRRKIVEQAFTTERQKLEQLLKAYHDAEVTRREGMIAEVAALDAGERGALQTLRALQQRWQAQAKTCPLPHKKEQVLWGRFRAECDRVFHMQQERAHAADAARKQNLMRREALCAALEAASAAPAQEIKALLQQVGEEWQKTRPVPTAAQQRIEDRYQQAMRLLQDKLAQQQSSLAWDKLRLCYATEADVARNQRAGTVNPEQRRREWQALSALSGPLEQALNKRFEAALSRLETPDQNYEALLTRNGAVLAELVMRLEILSGLESPSAMAAQRLSMQVELLKDSLQAGAREITRRDELLQLCQLPALPDAGLLKRMQRVLVRLGAQPTE